MNESLPNELMDWVPESLQKFHETSPAPMAYKARWEALEGDDYRQKAVGMLMFFLLEQMGKEFPKELCDMLPVVLRHTHDDHLIRVSAPLNELFGLLPNGDALRNQLQRQCLSAAMWRPEDARALLGPFSQPTREQLEDVLKALHEAPEQAPRLPPELALDRERWAGSAVVVWRQLSQQPPEPWMLEVVKREFQQRPDQDLGYDWRDALDCFPDGEKEALLISKPRPLWELISNHPTEAVLRDAMDKYVAQFDPEDPNHNPFWDSQGTADWIKLQCEAYAGAEGELRQRLGDIIADSFYVDDLSWEPPFAAFDARLTWLWLKELFNLHDEKDVRDGIAALWQSPSNATKEAILQLYTGWSLHYGVDEPLASVEVEEELEMALATARQRTQPDWDDLAIRFAEWDGEAPLFPENPYRQAQVSSMFDVAESMTNGIYAPFQHEPMMCLNKIVLESKRGYTDSDPFYRPVICALLRHYPLKPIQALYDEAYFYGILQRDVIFRMMKEGTPKYQLKAAKHAASLGEEVLPEVCELLQSTKAGVRSTAARALQFLALPGASDALTKALGKERSAKTRVILQEALDACQQTRSESTDLGTYSRNDTLTESQLLAQLREILSERRRIATWVRVCDLLERSRDTPWLGVAIDYLQSHGLEDWTERPLPWGWEQEPDLLALGEPSDITWIPVSVFLCKDPTPFLDDVLTTMEEGQKSRLLPRDKIPVFCEWIEKAWSWCAENNVGLGWLEVRLDGGIGSGYGGKSTSLSLWNDFGLTLVRGGASTVRSREPSVRWVRVGLPPKHSLRDIYPMRSGGRYIDLLEHL